MMGETTPVVRSTFVVPAILTREDQKCYNTERKGISAITVSNHATLVAVEEVEDSGMDMAAEVAEDVVDKELLI
jgi:hypothetical protein